ncbi:MAG TPA: aldehyde dehydrogenase family protein [Phenylobacterium sp.]|uniref:aldehyde dehydrogenase family protein n=1 Tax=Phenylobacterium sp. TaxID=1871053 RepID=UPI002B4A3780|nr:aldehyde dehydrogenase family protein [Phenylobacterium sp.]HKR90204.1 aldehyde dehydrogenase family protein [Phenylobacterium sp.]
MTYKMLVDGELLDSALRLDVVNPATGAPWASAPRATAGQAELAVAAAKRAQPAWAALPIEQRRKVLLALADRIEADADTYARTIVAEQGKPLAEANLEVVHSCAFLRAFAGMTLEPEVLQDDAAYRIEVRHRPLGVVVAITPWNFPLLIAAYKLAPALLLGNTFILKPAPSTPLSALLLGEAAASLTPPGVVNVIVDDNDLGPLLSTHPDVQKISFTGSTATGRKVMANAASTLKRLTLELGGNDAAIVLEDADVARAAAGIYGGAFFNAGQVCIAVKRVYAHRNVYDALCDALAALARQAVVGDGSMQGVTVGPLQNEQQYAKAQHYMEIAHRDGTVIAGGQFRDGQGFFVQPTIVRDIGADSPLVTEEQFAPILPVLPYADLDDVVTEVNAGEYGLGGSIWSSNEAKATALSERLTSGTIWINHHLHFAPHVPFAGAKQSGLGAEFGDEGLAEFAQMTVVSLARTAA